MIKVLFVILVLIVVCNGGFTPNCGFSYPNGTYVSLSALAGRYEFINEPPSHVPPAYDPQGNVTLEIQICGTLTTEYPNICNNANSVVNIISPDGQTCTSAGDVNVAAWQLNPSGNGVSLIYFHGDWVSHIDAYSTRIYFECQENITDDQVVLVYEFLNPIFYQYHLIIYTQRACADFAVTPPAPVTPSVTCGTSIFYDYPLDLSPTIIPNGGILYTNVTGGYPGTNITQPPITIEVQICGNVQTSFPDLCTIPSPANLINLTAGTCTPLGDISTYSWDLNPDSNEGVNLVYYHGGLIGTVETLQTRIYFECAAVFKDLPVNDVLFYEHYTESAYSYHFVIQTFAACPPNLLTTTTSTSSTTSSTTGSAVTSAAVTFSLSIYTITSAILVIMGIVVM